MKCQLDNTNISIVISNKKMKNLREYNGKIQKNSSSLKKVNMINNILW